MWSTVNTGLTDTAVAALAVDPDKPQTVYAGTFSGVFETGNGGTRWSRASNGLGDGNSVFALVVDPVTPTTVYAATVDGVFKSINGAGRWDAAGSGLPDAEAVYALGVVPANPMTLFAAPGGGRGVYKTVDGGTGWTAANGGFVNTVVRAIALDPAAPQTIYAGTFDDGAAKSIDGATMWSSANMGLTAPAIDALAVDPMSPAILYVGGNGGAVPIYRSADHAQSWVPSSVGISAAVTVRALAIDPSNASIVYAATDRGGVFKSTDGGGEWDPASSGLPVTGDDVVTVEDLAIDPGAPMNLYAASFAGIFASSDRAKTWHPVSTGLPNRPALSVAVDPADSNHLFAGMGGGGIFASTNRAASWQPANGGTGSQLESASVSDLTFADDHAGSVYAASSLGVLLSREGGQRWIGVNDGLFVRAANAIAVDPQDPRRVYAATTGGGVFTLLLTALHCGNGTIDAGEQCDGGIANGAAGSCCALDCRFADGASCDSGACASGERCAQGVCGGGEPVVCGPCQTCDQVAGCIGAVCTATATASATTTPSDTVTPSATSTFSTTPTPSEAATATASAAATPLDTATSTPLDTATTIPDTATAIPEDTSTPTADDTATATPEDTVTLPPVTPIACHGDCDGDGQVTIAELIRAVTIALETADVSVCPAVDADGDGTVTVNELILAVLKALGGCDGLGARAARPLCATSTIFG